MGNYVNKIAVICLPFLLARLFQKTLGLACGFFFIASLSAFAQNSPDQPIADWPSFKKQFATESLRLLSIRCDFTQEKILSALTEKITSTGKFWFKRSNKVRMEYTHPFFYLMIMNGDKMLVRDDQKENRITIKSNKLLQHVNRIIIDCVQGTILESKDFSVNVFENDKTFLLVMTPLSKTLAEFFKNIRVRVEKKDYSVQSIEMNEPLGDRTTILFTGKTLNEQLADAMFAL